MDYSKRRLSDVSATGLEIDRDGETHVSGYVTLQVSNFDDADAGPYINVRISVPFDENKSFQDAELALVSGARSLVSRFLEFSHEDWKKSLLRSRQADSNFYPTT